MVQAKRKDAPRRERKPRLEAVEDIAALPKKSDDDTGPELLDEPLTPEEEAQLDDVLDEMEHRLNEPESLHVQPHAGNSSSTLIAYCGARKITREELAQVPTPEPTRTHQPIAHIRVVETIVEALKFRHIGVVREEYAVTPDGGKMFGVFDLDYEFSTLDSFRFSVGLRNSNDKSMRLGITIGYRVLVCDNMAFKGDFTPVLAKHSRRLDLEETIALGVDRMQRGFAPLRRQVNEWQQSELSDEQAKLLIYGAFLERALPVPRHLMPLVHRHYFQPEYETFKPRTLWSLGNAFTSSFKELKPVRQFQATAKLGAFLARREVDSMTAGNLISPVTQPQLSQAVAAGA